MLLKSNKIDSFSDIKWGRFMSAIKAAGMTTPNKANVRQGVYKLGFQHVCCSTRELGQKNLQWGTQDRVRYQLNAT
jgi:hypothetical protein